MDILTRTLIASSLILIGLGAYWAWSHVQLRRLSRAPGSGLETWRPGLPAILYFTTPDCIPCRTTQRPALERLKAELADALQVIEVDASVQPAIADQWGVVSVPTTFILDPTGRPRRLNHGVASTAKLKQQLELMDRWR